MDSMPIGALGANTFPAGADKRRPQAETTKRALTDERRRRDIAKLQRLACTALAALCLSSCGVVSTAVVVTSAAVGVATTAAGVAVDGAVLVGKGVVKTGAAVVDAVSDDEKTQ